MVLAHAGGLDEALILVLPMVICLFFWLFTRQRRPPDCARPCRAIGPEEKSVGLNDSVSPLHRLLAPGSRTEVGAASAGDAERTPGRDR
ncbi:MAG: hypothetical protein ACRD0A_03680 [Acidimicrobiales bacterium]